MRRVKSVSNENSKYFSFDFNWTAIICYDRNNWKAINFQMILFLFCVERRIISTVNRMLYVSKMVGNYLLEWVWWICVSDSASKNLVQMVFLIFVLSFLFQRFWSNFSQILIYLLTIFTCLLSIMDTWQCFHLVFPENVCFWS